MKRRLASFAVALISAVIWDMILQMPRFRPDDFGLALAPIAIGLGVSITALVLSSAWVLERWLRKITSATAVVLASLLWFVALTIGFRLGESKWFSDGYCLLGFHTLAVFVPTFIFSMFAFAKRRPNQQPP